MLDSQLEIQSRKSSHGGKRDGAGRKPGKLSSAKLELRDLAKEHAPDMLRQLVDIAKNSSSDTAKVSAIKEVLDRAYGKAPQAIVGDDDEPAVKTIMEIVWGGSTGSAS